MCTLSKSVNYILAWVILVFICPPLQCFFNPFRALTLVQPPPVQAPPIRIKVPKKNLKEVTEFLKNNPEYLRDLTVNSRNSNTPITLESTGRINPSSNALSNNPEYLRQLSANPRNSEIPIIFSPTKPINPSSNGYQTHPAGRYGTTSQLPEEVMIDGQKHYKTTRASLFFNQGLKLFNSIIPAKAVPGVADTIFIDYDGNNNKPKKNEKKEEKEDVSQYEYEYEYEDEDDDNNNDKKKEDKKNDNKKNNKASDKKYVNPEQNRKGKGNQKQSVAQQYEDSFESGENLMEDDQEE